MSEILTNKVTPANLKGNTVTLGNSGDIFALGVGATSTGFGNLDVIKDPANPATDTNPPSGVGMLWLNTTTGCLFSCTDATTDANEWINTANCGADNIPVTTGEAYLVAGDRATVRSDTISEFSFSSSVESIIGSIDRAMVLQGSNSSTTEGFVHGGTSENISDKATQFPTRIEKFAFASGNISTPTHGNISRNLFDTANTNSSTHGYLHGGRGFEIVGAVTSSEKFTFANSDVTTTQVFTLDAQTFTAEGHSTNTNGYVFGGTISGVVGDAYFEFSFASDTTKTNFGTMTIGRSAHNVTGNLTDAFIVGGGSGGTNLILNIERISLSTSNTKSSHGDLVSVQNQVTTASTATHGVIVGGNGGNGADTVTKQIFAYASDSGASLVAPLSLAANGSAPCQSPAF
jgi:hypothetical protein